MPRRIFIEAEVTPQVALLCREPVASTRHRPLTCSAVLLSTSPNARAGLPQFVCAPSSGHSSQVWGTQFSILDPFQFLSQDGKCYLRFAGKWHPVVERGIVPAVEALPHLVKQSIRLTVAAAVTEYLVETKLSKKPKTLAAYA